nr:hypothetical protein [Tanacetum cinerariifolium]
GIERKLGMQVTDQAQVRQLLQQGATKVSQWIPTLASSVLNVIVIVGLMLFTMYYLFMQEEGFLAGLHRYLPFREKTLDELSESLRNNVNANVLGQGVVALGHNGQGIGILIVGVVVIINVDNLLRIWMAKLGNRAAVAFIPHCADAEEIIDKSMNVRDEAEEIRRTK